MEIKLNKDYCISSVDVRDINNKEMRQMYELKNRINDVLDSHKPEAKEKKYISDDDLQLMRAILRVFTREYASTQTSAFDDELKAINRVSHDRRANATGRSCYTFCGKKVIISHNDVFRNGYWIGHLYIDGHGQKYVYGPKNKGQLQTTT